MNAMPLETQSRFADPDAAYRLLVAAHRELDASQHAAFDAALVLILANHVGDAGVLAEAIALAKAAVAGTVAAGRNDA